jgi:hypothetical protein
MKPGVVTRLYIQIVFAVENMMRNICLRFSKQTQFFTDNVSPTGKEDM